MRKKALIAGLAALALVLGIVVLRKPAARAPQAAASPLYTGKEGKRKVKLFYPSTEKPGLGARFSEIFATPSRSAQAKQVLDLLFADPGDKAMARAFPEGARWRELYFDEAARLCVVDFEEDLPSLHPGGTSSEFSTLYALVKTLLENFKEAEKVQVLIGGKAAETLAGHLDISRPLNLADF